MDQLAPVDQAGQHAQMVAHINGQNNKIAELKAALQVASDKGRPKIPAPMKYSG